MSLWESVAGYVKQVAALTAQTRKNTEEVEKLQVRVDELTDAMKLFAFQLQRLQDQIVTAQQNEAHEREKMALRLENYLLRKGIAPPPEDNS